MNVPTKDISKTKRRILNYLIIVPPGAVLGIVGNIERSDAPIGGACAAILVLLLIWAGAVWKSGCWR